MAADHGAQALRHEQSHRHVNYQEEKDDRHREEVDEPRAFIAAKQGSKLSQLYGLPESQTGGNDDNPRQQKAGVDQLLHGIVAAKITMAEPTSDRRTKIAHDLGREYRQELLPEVPSHQPNRHIHRTIDEKQPHG